MQRIRMLTSEFDLTLLVGVVKRRLRVSPSLQVLAPYVCMENMSNFDCFTDGRWVSSENNSTLYELSQG